MEAPEHHVVADWNIHSTEIDLDHSPIDSRKDLLYVDEF